MNKQTVDIAFDLNELVELDEALATKLNYIDTGRFGPEERPGEDRRWMDDLKAIKAKVRAAMLRIEGGKQS